VDQVPQQTPPGQETLLARIKRGLAGGTAGAGSRPTNDSASPAPVKGWSDTLTTISTGVVAIATLATWLFGGTRAFPQWLSYLLTLFVLVAVFKYSESHARRLSRFLSLRHYVRQQRFKLVDMIQGFNDLISSKLDDSVTSAHWKIAGRNGRPIVDTDLFGYPERTLSNILLRLSDAGARISIAEFKGVLGDMGVLVGFCSRFYFRKPVEENRLGEVHPDDLKSLEFARENFADFVRRFQAFDDEVQLRMGTPTRARLEIPKPL
jgi:hypothetical protein